MTCCVGWGGVHVASDILDETQLFEILNSSQKLVLAFASRHIAIVSRLCVERSDVSKVVRLCAVDGRWINNGYEAIFGITLTRQI